MREENAMGAGESLVELEQRHLVNISTLTYIDKRKQAWRHGSMAVLPEGPTWTPSTHMAVYYCNSKSRGFDPFFWPLQTLGTYTLHRHICRQNTHIHKIKMKTIRKKLKRRLKQEEAALFLT